jgi:hypothetical protein
LYDVILIYSTGQIKKGHEPDAAHGPPVAHHWSINLKIFRTGKRNQECTFVKKSKEKKIYITFRWKMMVKNKRTAKLRNTSEDLY